MPLAVVIVQLRVSRKIMNNKEPASLLWWKSSKLVHAWMFLCQALTKAKYTNKTFKFWKYTFDSKIIFIITIVKGLMPEWVISNLHFPKHSFPNTVWILTYNYYSIFSLHRKKIQQPQGFYIKYSISTIQIGFKISSNLGYLYK